MTSDAAPTLSVALNPVRQLEAVDGASHGQRWVALGVDPQFKVEHAQGGSFGAGWYLLDIDLHIHRGFFDAPCLYPDYGKGWREEDRINLARSLGAGSGARAIVRFSHDVQALRFDPSTAPCSFDLATIRLARLGKLSVTMRMLGKLASRLAHEPALLPSFMRDALASLRDDGLRGFGDWLYRSHEDRSQGGDVLLDYAAWVQRFDHVSEADARDIGGSQDLASKPLISIVVPVYNTPETYLRRCLDSVLAQLYPHWELCIADDASSMPHVADVLSAYVARDPRIRVITRETNGHISEASNSALALASGEYVALLDHDDELAPHALYLIAKAINEQPTLKLLYSDEDKLDENGARFDPYFKPDWNPELLLSHNFICHLAVYQTALVTESGGFRRGFEGSQDLDLALRCIARLQPSEIGHIPHVLYHWRAMEGSTALSGSAKGYTEEAGKRAIEDHLACCGEGDAQVSLVTGGYRVRYALPSRSPTVSLIIPTRDRLDLLRTCVDSICRLTTYPDFEIVIVDNQSTERQTHAYFEEIKRRGNVRVLPYDAPFNYSRLNNFAVRESSSDVIALVNNDIEAIHGDWLHEMVGHAIRPQNGAVGAMLYYPDGRIQHAGVIIGLGGVAGHAYVGMPRGFPGQHHRAHLCQNLTAVTAACLVVRRDVFDEVGGLDESFEVAFNDVDFCLRIAQRGYRNVWTPWAELYHHESATRGYEDNPEKQARFSGEIERLQGRWGDALKWDPAYSPNLSLESHNFALAFPPRMPVGESLRNGRAVLSSNGQGPSLLRPVGLGP
jgi:GT2 family glycosyltransferase